MKVFCIRSESAVGVRGGYCGEVFCIRSEESDVVKVFCIRIIGEGAVVKVWSESAIVKVFRIRS